MLVWGMWSRSGRCGASMDLRPDSRNSPTNFSTKYRVVSPTKCTRSALSSTASATNPPPPLNGDEPRPARFIGRSASARGDEKQPALLFIRYGVCADALGRHKGVAQLFSRKVCVTETEVRYGLHVTVCGPTGS